MTAWTERFRELEPDWTRAPSAHNTQPWTVDYAADEVVLGWDRARELPAGTRTGATSSCRWGPSWRPA
ncbi:hypothetical protein ACFQZC_11460 [Streptacidiphilus monticola]